MPDPNPQVEVPEEAVELAAEALWNEHEYRDPTGEAPDDWYPPGDNPQQEPPREPFLWEQMVSEGKFDGDQADYRKDAAAALQAAAPAIRAQERERLLGKGEPVEGGCQKPNACEWKWWPDHCQCATANGARADAPEPPEMVERNRLSAANETNARAKRDQERVEAAASYLRKEEETRKKAEAERDQAAQQERERIRERLALIFGFGADRDEEFLAGRKRFYDEAIEELNRLSALNPEDSSGAEDELLRAAAVEDHLKEMREPKTPPFLADQEDSDA